MQGSGISNRPFLSYQESVHAQAVARGKVKLQKTGRVYRTVDLLPPLQDDLAVWFKARGHDDPDARLFARDDGEWFKTDDWNNWRNRHFYEALDGLDISRRRPDDLRHSFVSLMIREGQLPIVELAEQLGHAATETCDRAFDRIAAARNDLGRALAAACGEQQVEFASLTAPDGANIDALANECADVQVDDVTALPAYAMCLARSHECRIATLVRNATPRLRGGRGVTAGQHISALCLLRRCHPTPDRQRRSDPPPSGEGGQMRLPCLRGGRRRTLYRRQ